MPKVEPTADGAKPPAIHPAEIDRFSVVVDHRLLAMAGLCRNERPLAETKRRGLLAIVQLLKSDVEAFEAEVRATL